MKHLDLLIELQGLDDKISVIDDKLGLLPALIQEHYSATNAAKEAHENFLKAVEADKKLRKEKEAEVKIKEEGMAKAKNKLHEIKTNAEYKAALKEIDNIKKDISRLEDDQLDLMEKIDESVAKEKELKVKVDFEEKEFKEIKSEKEAEIEQINIEKSGYLSQREKVASQIDAKLIAHYDKIFPARDRKAVAELINGYCTACHQSVLPQTALEVRTRTHLHTCSHCQRFLYGEVVEHKAANE